MRAGRAPVFSRAYPEQHCISMHYHTQICKTNASRKHPNFGQIFNFLVEAFPILQVAHEKMVQENLRGGGLADEIFKPMRRF